ncbi:MAG TPA: hypothetical protein PKA27_11855 [Fimbriimonadaceae bacterium]|nr:hypothetical protein [Fimbriimonadaceae bacterium]
MRRSRFVGLMVLGACQGIASDRIPVYFIAENFMWTRPGREGAINRISWLYGEAQLNRNVKLVGSYIDLPTPTKVRRILDEGFVEVAKDSWVGRAGRIRTRFGFNDWSELFYTPIIQFAIIRSNPITPQLGLLRFDTGVDVQGGSPELQVQAGVVDVANDGWELAPQNADHVALRLQSEQGQAIIGISTLTKVRGTGTRNGMIGLDVRWSKPEWMARFEAVKGYSRGANGHGAYLDVFYRPQRWFRTQFGVRGEFYESLAGVESSLLTLGVRQILSKEFTLSVNYGHGSRTGAAAGMRGWTVQLMTALRF